MRTENKISIALVMLLLLAPFALFAQEAENQWQYLQWEESDPDAVLHYDVVLEERDAKTNEYKEINRCSTQSNETQIQAKTKNGDLLKPGNYRYKVITYNLIGVPDTESDWYNFTVYQAYQPAVTDAKTSVNLTGTVYLDENNDGIFTISGKNLFTNAEDKNDISFTNYELINIKQKKNEKPLVPVVIEHDDNNRKMKVQFDMDKLDVGTYNFTATDASGLKSENSSGSLVTVKFRKWLDIDACAGYTVPVALYDDTFRTYLNTNTFPLSAAFRLTVIPFKHRYGYLGMAVSGSYTRIFSTFDNYTIDGNMMLCHLDFVYQLPVIRNRFMLEVHGGAGTTIINNVAYHFSHNIDTDPLNSVNLSVNAGGAVQLYVFKRLYVDVCVDYVQAFMTDMSLGMIVPTVSAGWQF